VESLNILECNHQQKVCTRTFKRDLPKSPDRITYA
jgi:hypothetical protein